MRVSSRPKYAARSSASPTRPIPRYSVRRVGGKRGASERLDAYLSHWRFAPGETYQFDWSYETVELGGQVQTVEVVHLRLRHSRVFLAASLRSRVSRPF